MVQAEPVRRLIEDVDPRAVPQEGADQALGGVQSGLASAHTGSHAPTAGSALDQLTAAQIATIFAAFNLLVIAAVAACYGYDVGKAADVVAWPLALLGVVAWTVPAVADSS